MLAIDELVVFSRYLSTCIKQDRSLPQALDALAEDTHDRTLKQALLDSSQSIQQGKSLAESLSPKLFPANYCSFIRMGEQHGQLAKILDLLTDSLKNLLTTRLKISHSLRYVRVLFFIAPLFCLMISGLAYNQYSIFKPLFDEMGVTLPALTLLTLKILPGLPVALLFLLAIAAYLIFQPGRAKHRMELNLPFLGYINRTKHFSDIFNMLSILLKTGIPMPQALREVSQTISNKLIQAHLDAMARKIENGSSFSVALSESPLFTQTQLSQIKQGEQSGNLFDTLKTLSQQAIDELNLGLTYQAPLHSFVVLSFIILTLPLALSLISLYLPMFSVIGSIQG